DVKTYYVNYLTPKAASFRIVGAVSETDAKAALEKIDAAWQGGEIAYPDAAAPAAPEKSTVYFVDVPGAKQSVFRFGYPALTVTDPDYYPAAVMNYRLGGGGFASRLTQELREGKGYTYGIGSGFSGSARYGGFNISSGVRSNVTYEAAALVKDILENYSATFTEEDLDVTKSFMLKSKARAFETLGAKLGMLQNIADYDLPYDYVKEQNEIVEAMTVERIQELADDYIRPGAMNWVIAGDAETQAPRLEALGYGAPVMLGAPQE
ncbi:MAG: insulinase family protein, partial [Oricola sp.]|nr:insulinase family protein [Oricola sp.]